MGDESFADQLSRLDETLRRKQEKRAKESWKRSLRQQRLNEVHRGLLMLFQARSRVVSVKSFRMIVEACQSDLTDLSKAVQSLFKPEELDTFLERIGFVRMSLASADAPALREYLGHIVGVVLEGPERCAVLVFPTDEISLGSLRPLAGQLMRLEIGGTGDLHRQESEIDRALAGGLKWIVEEVEKEAE